MVLGQNGKQRHLPLSREGSGARSQEEVVNTEGPRGATRMGDHKKQRSIGEGGLTRGSGRVDSRTRWINSIRRHT